MQQVADFIEESEVLDTVLVPLGDAEYETPTLFKGWTINEVLQHLHFFNVMAIKSAFDPDTFTADYEAFRRMRAEGDGEMTGPTDRLLGGLSGRALRAAWRDTVAEMGERFADADPKARVKWAGPDMSVRSSITARQMETWAHGQEIFDVLGARREEGDRLRNIAHLGVQTYGWTFVNRGEDVPEPAPHVRLTAPSGEIWDWGAPDQEERVEGRAVDFCQVVAQTRNIADVDLAVTGQNATRWMSIAQCFAGPPVDPPAPGARRPASGQREDE